MTDDLSRWIDGLVAERRVPQATCRIIEVLRRNPQVAAFSTVQAMSELAEVNIATVTRAAQFLGFRGWPDFILDYRGHYLAQLGADTVLAPAPAVGAESGPRFSVQQDVRALQSLAESLDEERVAAAAERLAASRRTVVLATGTYLAPANVLAHNAQLLGYDFELPYGSASTQMNAVRKLGPEDTLIIFNIWKTAAIVPRLAKFAHARRVPIVAFADRTTPAVGLADVVLTVPSEGARYLPSSIPAVSAVQAVLNALADLDRDRTERSLREADELWGELGIVSGD